VTEITSPGVPVNTACARAILPARQRRHRPISIATWSAIAAAISRERGFLEELEPHSPRIRPTLALVVWLNREPGMAAETRRAA
jgi:hypothetical protein